MIKSFLAPIRELDHRGKRNFIFLGLAYFFALMSYPIIRSSSDAFLIQAHGAKSWPWATFFSVITLFLCIVFFSRVQRRVGVKKLYVMVSLFSVLFFICAALAWRFGFQQFAYLAYIWKESYAVILIHFCLAFFNSYFNYNVAKLLLGPLGAIVSIGSIIGGALTFSITKQVGIFWLIVSGAGICLLSPLFFALLFERSDRAEGGSGHSAQEARPGRSNPSREFGPMWPALRG